ncbi:hypothetical protein D3C83_317690 [compost metagenome]
MARYFHHGLHDLIGKCFPAGMACRVGGHILDVRNHLLPLTGVIVSGMHSI